MSDSTPTHIAFDTSNGTQAVVPREKMILVWHGNDYAEVWEAGVPEDHQSPFRITREVYFQLRKTLADE